MTMEATAVQHCRICKEQHHGTDPTLCPACEALKRICKAAEPILTAETEQTPLLAVYLSSVDGQTMQLWIEVDIGMAGTSPTIRSKSLEFTPTYEDLLSLRSEDTAEQDSYARRYIIPRILQLLPEAYKALETRLHCELNPPIPDPPAGGDYA